MKAFRLVVIALFVSLSFVLASPSHTMRPGESYSPALLAASSVTDYHFPLDSTSEVTDDSGDAGGIREEIPAKYVERYQDWKREFLATESGRQQWHRYATDPLLKLSITVSRDNAEGATTGKYKWNEDGQLIAATIVLGFRLDEGYPNPIYFPVMNSLVPTGAAHDVTGNTLAATKIAHEFGHLNRTVKVDTAL